MTSSKPSLVWPRRPNEGTRLLCVKAWGSRCGSTAGPAAAAAGWDIIRLTLLFFTRTRLYITCAASAGAAFVSAAILSLRSPTNFAVSVVVQKTGKFREHTYANNTSTFAILPDLKKKKIEFFILT